MDETGWVIERDMKGARHYWTGRVDEMRAGGNVGENQAVGINLWTKDHRGALRFARKLDAEIILYRLCAGVGRSVEHVWMQQ